MTTIQALFAKQSRQASTTAPAISSQPTGSIRLVRTQTAAPICAASSKYIITNPNLDAAACSRPRQPSQSARTRTLSFDPARTPLNSKSRQINANQRIISSKEKENVVPQQTGLLNTSNQLTMRTQNQSSLMDVASTSQISDNNARSCGSHDHGRPVQYEIQFDAGTIDR